MGDIKSGLLAPIGRRKPETGSKHYVTCPFFVALELTTLTAIGLADLQVCIVLETLQQATKHMRSHSLVALLLLSDRVLDWPVA